MSCPVVVSAVSEDSLLVTWLLDEGEVPSANLARLISALGEALVIRYGEKIQNVVPAYQTLLVQYQAIAIDYQELAEAIQVWLDETDVQLQASPECHRIPVWYHAEVGPDLEALCEAKGLSLDECIRRHTAVEYTVFAVGFQPGFAYLGYVDECLQMPRHASFRPVVAAGSVAIADRQTAIYPSASPGGWQIIGRTPHPPLHGQFRAGDTVRFEPLDQAEYQRRAIEQAGREPTLGRQ